MTKLQIAAKGGRENGSRFGSGKIFKKFRGVPTLHGQEKRFEGAGVVLAPGARIWPGEWPDSGTGFFVVGCFGMFESWLKQMKQTTSGFL